MRYQFQSYKNECLCFSLLPSSTSPDYCTVFPNFHPCVPAITSLQHQKIALVQKRHLRISCTKDIKFVNHCLTRYLVQVQHIVHFGNVSEKSAKVQIPGSVAHAHSRHSQILLVSLLSVNNKNIRFSS